MNTDLKKTAAAANSSAAMETETQRHESAKALTKSRPALLRILGNVAVLTLLLSMVTTCEPSAKQQQLKQLEKLTPADMTDVKAYGFYGKVKTVKFGECGIFWGMYGFEFDREGKIVNELSSSGAVSNKYAYSDATHYSNSGNDYTITFGTNDRKDTSKDQFSHITIEYKFDLYGRIVSHKYTDVGTQDFYQDTFTYSGTNKFPTSSEYLYAVAEGGENHTYKYNYLKFDEHGNWTERIIYREGQKDITQTAEYTYFE